MLAFNDFVVFPIAMHYNSNEYFAHNLFGLGKARFHSPIRMTRPVHRANAQNQRLIPKTAYY